MTSTILRGIAATLLVLLLAGCAAGETVDQSSLPRLVLQSGDVPDLALFDEGPQGRGDLPPGERSDPARFGRQGGWKARFRRPGGSAQTSGPLVVESRADVFAHSDGASQDFDAARAELGKTWRQVDAPDLGDASIAATMLQRVVAGDVRYFTILWRDDNVVASLLVQGFDERMTLDDAAALARLQQTRIGAARRS